MSGKKSKMSGISRLPRDNPSGPRDEFQAPGRVNLIGEHTDYNDGFVLPAAIQLQTRVAIRGSSAHKLQIRSTLYSDAVIFDLGDPHPAPAKAWTDYVVGVTAVLAEEGIVLSGAELQIRSDIPPGAGLSSSAALEVAAAYALLSLSGYHPEPREVARICHRAENEFVGTRSGIMDQFASCLGRRNHAMLLDCRSLAVDYVPLPAGVVMMVCNTMVRHELASGEYNKRRSECEQGVDILSRLIPGVRALRDVTPAQLESFPAEFDPVIQRRCRHVVEENRRVVAAVDALTTGNLDRLGVLMIESHQSLRLDYEVSCDELDWMCEFALRAPGVYGARMVGGGFGGCVLALVKEPAVSGFRKFVAGEYYNRTGIQCEIYECFAAGGAGPVHD